MRKLNLKSGHEVLVDDRDYDLVSSYRWYVHKVHRKFNYVRAFVHRRAIYMHTLILGSKPNQQIDHVDGNGLNNCRVNLRHCSIAQNVRNRKKTRGSSRFKGVSKITNSHKWGAFISIEGRNKNLGRFASEIDAAMAYNIAAKIHYGEFAKLNEIGGTF